MISTYLSNIINNHKTQGKWKIQLTIAISYISSKYSDDTRIMRYKSDNIEIMMGSETGETIEELFESLLQEYQGGLEESMKGSEYIFDSVNSLCYKLHKTSLNRSGSYIDSPKQLKNQKATINPENNDGKCSQYALNKLLH